MKINHFTYSNLNSYNPADRRVRNPYYPLIRAETIWGQQDTPLEEKKMSIHMLVMQTYYEAMRWAVLNPFNWFKATEIADAKAVYPHLRLFALSIGVPAPAYSWF